MEKMIRYTGRLRLWGRPGDVWSLRWQRRRSVHNTAIVEENDDKGYYIRQDFRLNSPGTIYLPSSHSSFLSSSMPAARKTRGRLKNISCPRCGKKFCSESNVLRHMNQPMGICYAASWYQDHSNLFNESSQDVPTAPDFVTSDPYHIPADSDVQPDADSMDREESGHTGIDSGYTGTPQTFTEVFPGSSASYPGGATFMDIFWQDRYAEERKQNRFYPFASEGEWQFSSWCLRSGLSMAAIDSLLSLSIVSH